MILSGIASQASGVGQASLTPSASLQTRDSVAMIVRPAKMETVRVASGVSPISSFSSGMAVAAASTGEAGAGIRPLADVVDPNRPFVVYVAAAGDSVSTISSRFKISLGTLLDNNPTVEDKDLIRRGQELIVPRQDGILYKIGYGDTLGDIVDEFDNITVNDIVAYRPNGLQLNSALQEGEYLLLIGATRKPPPPPPPPPPPRTGFPAPPSGEGRFAAPLGAWLAVSDPFGTARGGGRIHEGIDLDLAGYWSSPIYSACEGPVIKTEYLTHSYGSHVVVDCGDGWTTLYAHFSEIHVNPGQWVSQGSVLGVSGVTGFTTGEHLHFEIRLNGAPVDPSAYIDFY